jgi:ribA/ribD-fused uncharacterized protein
MKQVLFWKPENENGYLSNFYKCCFVDELNNRYNCNEQYFMKKKQEMFDSCNNNLSKQIMNERNPQKIKNLGRMVNHFNQIKWDKNKEQIMKDGLYLKFSQNEILKIKLLQTYPDRLIENSPFDSIWGIGSDSKGKNLLDKALANTRQKLIYDSKQ